MSAPDRNDPPEAILERAFEAFARRDCLACHEILEDGLDDYPDDGQLWQLAGMCRFVLQDPGGARDAFETATTLIPIEPVPRLCLGDCYALAGRHGLAIDVYQLVAEDERFPSRLLPAIAERCDRLGRTEAAQELLERFVQCHPQDAEGQFLLARYRSRSGSPPEDVLEPLLVAVQLDPCKLPYRVMAAALLLRSGRRNEAQQLIAVIVPESVHCITALRQLIGMTQELGDDERCDAFLTQKAKLLRRTDEAK